MVKSSAADVVRCALPVAVSDLPFAPELGFDGTDDEALDKPEADEVELSKPLDNKLAVPLVKKELASEDLVSNELKLVSVEDDDNSEGKLEPSNEEMLLVVTELEKDELDVKVSELKPDELAEEANELEF